MLSLIIGLIDSLQKDPIKGPPILTIKAPVVQGLKPMAPPCMASSLDSFAHS